MNAVIRVFVLQVFALALLSVVFAAQVSAVPVTTGLLLRYDGTNITTISGNQVASWNNQGSVGALGDAIPRLTTARPTVLVNALNSQNVVNFAGQNQEVLKSVNFPSLAQPNTLFIVVRDTANNSPVIFDGVNSTDRNFFRPQAGGNFHLYAGTSIVGGSGAIPNQYMIYTVRFDQAASTVHANGNLAFTVGASIGTQPLGSVSIGNSEPNNSPSSLGLNGQLAEILFYDTPLNQAQRIVTENYLSSKFNIGPTVLGANRTLGVNDFYAGDLDSNGDYDRDVFGVGQSGGQAFSLDASAGFAIEVTSGLDNGDFMMAGHKVANNTVLGSRWERVWYLDNRLDGDEGITLTFDWSDAGLGSPNPGLVQLMYAATDGGLFESIATGVVSGDTVTFSGLLASDLLNGYYTLGAPPAPEPASFMLVTGGLFVLISSRRRRILEA